MDGKELHVTDVAELKVIEVTRVCIGAKQTAKGAITLDIKAEAPTVKKAGELLDGAIKELIAKLRDNGLSLVSE